MERKQLKPWQGIVSFIIMMIIFTVVAIPVQGNLGLIGVGITELLLLVMAVVAAKVTKQDLKEVFPIHKPKAREVFGTLLCWGGTFLLTTVGNLILFILFTEHMTAVNSDLTAVIGDGSVWLSVIIVSLMPAICEEAVHRGFILHTFKGVKKEWVIVLSMGIIFGVFHMDPLRALGTGILGAGLTWVMLKTKNMVMPAIFHATNNLLPVLVTFATSAASEAMTSIVGENQEAAEVALETISDSQLYTVSLGYYLIMAAVAPLLLVGGTALLKPKGEKMPTKYLVIALVLGAVLVIGGIAVLACNFDVLMEMSGVSMEELGL